MNVVDLTGCITSDCFFCGSCPNHVRDDSGTRHVNDRRMKAQNLREELSFTKDDLNDFFVCQELTRQNFIVMIVDCSTASLEIDFRERVSKLAVIGESIANIFFVLLILDLVIEVRCFVDVLILRRDGCCC